MYSIPPIGTRVRSSHLAYPNRVGTVTNWKGADSGRVFVLWDGMKRAQWWGIGFLECANEQDGKENVRPSDLGPFDGRMDDPHA